MLINWIFKRLPLHTGLHQSPLQSYRKAGEMNNLNHEPFGLPVNPVDFDSRPLNMLVRQAGSALEMPVVLVLLRSTPHLQFWSWSLGIRQPRNLPFQVFCLRLFTHLHFACVIVFSITIPFYRSRLFFLDHSSSKQAPLVHPAVRGSP